MRANFDRGGNPARSGIGAFQLLLLLFISFPSSRFLDVVLSPAFLALQRARRAFKWLRRVIRSIKSLVDTSEIENGVVTSSAHPLRSALRKMP